MVGFELAQLGDESLSSTISYLESIITPFYPSESTSTLPIENDDDSVEPKLLLQYRHFLQRVYLNLQEPLLQVPNPQKFNNLTLSPKESFVKSNDRLW